jgi:hypothetical protein
MYIEMRRRPRQRVVAIMAGALLAAVGLPAVAQAACPTTPTTKAFQRFGDPADYSLLSNGHFEAGRAAGPSPARPSSRATRASRFARARIRGR